jgi:hypothetical protein
MAWECNGIELRFRGMSLHSYTLLDRFQTVLTLWIPFHVLSKWAFDYLPTDIQRDDDISKTSFE